MNQILVTILIAAFACSALANEFHVSPTGNDTNSGTAVAPFASLDRARLAVRAVNAAMTGDILVRLAPGDYPVTAPVTFDAADSGQNGHQVIYRASGSPGSARLVGGQRVTGWQPWQGQIVYADIGGAVFHTLYENGRRARKARFPNLVPDATLPLAQADYLRATGASGSRNQLNYAAGALDPSSWNLAEAQIHMWSGGKWSWFTDTVPIASVNTSTRTITLAEDARYPIFQDSVGSRFFVQGVLALLDQPGEFHYDAQAGRLYYWPMDGPAAEQEIIVPRTRRILSLTGGSAAARVTNLRFEGLGIEFTDFTGWFRHAYPFDGQSGVPHLYPQFDRQATMPQHHEAAVYMENTESITFDACVIRNTGYSGVMSYGANRYNTFQRCRVSRVGMHGILFEGLHPGEGDVQTENTVDNCFFQDMGEQAGHGAGVQLTNASQHEISHSVIDRATRYGLCLNAYIDIPKADMYAHGNSFHHLRITNCAQDSGDMGVVNAWGISDDVPYLVNSFEQLLVDDTRANASMADYAPNGVFMDNDTNGQNFTDIEVRNSQGVAFRINQSPLQSLTNVSWQGGFDASRMDYETIGVRADHPFAVAPIRLAGQTVSGGVALTWLPVANAASYTVWSAASASGPWQILASGIATPTYTDSSPRSDVRLYRVTTISPLGGISEPSAFIAMNPPTAPGVIGFEIDQSYTTGTIGALNGGTTNAPFTGQQGWSLSSSTGTGAIIATSTSGEYVGGQALGASTGNINGDTYIGGIRGIIETATINTISFDLRFQGTLNVGAGFLGDNDADGLFDHADAGMQFGVSASAVWARNREFGTNIALTGITNSSLTPGGWYGFDITIGEVLSGNRSIAISVRDLTNSTDLDLNGASAGTAYTFSAPVADFGVAPADAVGGFVRVTQAGTSADRAAIDNLRCTAVPSPGSYVAWALANGVTGTMREDDDNDGVDNGIEFFLGDDSSGFTALPVLDAANTITWNKGGGYIGTYGADQDYVLETSMNLSFWTAVPALSVTDSPSALSYTLPSGEDRLFVRLRVMGP